MHDSVDAGKGAVWGWTEIRAVVTRRDNEQPEEVLWSKGSSSHYVCVYYATV